MIIEGYFSSLSLKLYVVTLLLNRLVKTIQVRGHNICLYAFQDGSDEGSQHISILYHNPQMPNL